METDRILLRPWVESDAQALYKYASDPEVGPRAGWPPHKSVEESLEIIRTVFNDATNTWAIVLKETGEPIGAMGYGPSCQCNLPAREGEPLIGYWVARPYWNQGICTEALRLMIDHIRKTTNIKSLISGHFVDNPASGRVMEKCGFVPTGETVVDPEQGRDTPIRVLRLELRKKTIPVWKWALLFLASIVLALIMVAAYQSIYLIPIPRWAQEVSNIPVAAAMLGLYALFVRLFEGAPAKDLPLKKALPHIGIGLAVGVGMFALVVGVQWATGMYRANSIGMEEPIHLLYAFLAFLSVAVAEEIAFRGVIFRWVDEKWGFPAALVVSGLLFGLLHILNPGATWWSSLAIAIEAGLMLGAAYKFSGTLWLPIGIHWAWNFTQGNIFGFAVSGTQAGDSLIQATVAGPDILTGGAFGAEASIITVILGAIISAWFIRSIPGRCRAISGRMSGR